MRRAADLDSLQANEAADAVIDVHHQITGGQTGGLGDEIIGTAHGASRPHQTVTEDVCALHVGAMLTPAHGKITVYPLEV